MQLTDRLEKLITALQKNIFEKDIIFRLAALAMLSGESVFLLGKPGLAKSLIARRIKYAWKESTFFEYLMNRFSTPEEIFGPISISELQKGNYVRIIDSYLPTANVAFLDEIWKAGPSIQNTLLTIINEKIYRNGGKDVDVPLRLLISASNELPAENQGLEALFDRFIIRFICDGLKQEKIFNNMIASNTSLEVDIDDNLKITNEEYLQWKKESRDVEITQETFDFIHRFRKALLIATNNEAYISDRRWKKIAGLMKSSAYFNGRTTVDKPDWLVIPHCIWDNDEQEVTYSKLFLEHYIKGLSYEIKRESEKWEAELSETEYLIDNLDSKEVVCNIYVDPFNGEIKGNYYRIIWSDQSRPICFISVRDIQKLKSQRSSTVTLYYSSDLTKLMQKEKVQVSFKSKFEIIDKDSQSIWSLEVKDSQGANWSIEELNKKVSELEAKIVLLREKRKLEQSRLESLPSIFFKHQYQLALKSAFSSTESEITLEEFKASL